MTMSDSHYQPVESSYSYALVSACAFEEHFLRNIIIRFLKLVNDPLYFMIIINRFADMVSLKQQLLVNLPKSSQVHRNL